MNGTELDKTYFILTGAEATVLEARVTEWMAKGWKPQGGVYITFDPHGKGAVRGFWQAMVREVPNGKQ